MMSTWQTLLFCPLVMKYWLYGKPVRPIEYTQRRWKQSVSWCYRVDPQGRIWNFGYLSGTGKIAIYDMNSDGSLHRTSVIEAPNADMVHVSFRDRLVWDASGAVEILVIDKQNLSIVHRFELPPFFAFHQGNAWQDGDVIRIEVASSPDFDPLMDDIALATQGKRAQNAFTRAQAIEANPR